MFPHKTDNDDNMTPYDDPESSNPFKGTNPFPSIEKDPDQQRQEIQKKIAEENAAKNLLHECTKYRLISNKPGECKGINGIDDAKKIVSYKKIRKKYAGGFYRSKRRRSRNRKSKKTRKSRKNRRKSKRRSPR